MGSSGILLCILSSEDAIFRRTPLKNYHIILDSSTLPVPFPNSYYPFSHCHSIIHVLTFLFSGPVFPSPILTYPISSHILLFSHFQSLSSILPFPFPYNVISFPLSFSNSCINSFSNSALI